MLPAGQHMKRNAPEVGNVNQRLRSIQQKYRLPPFRLIALFLTHELKAADASARDAETAPLKKTGPGRRLSEKKVESGSG